jgi:hypothetical protein
MGESRGWPPCALGPQLLRFSIRPPGYPVHAVQAEHDGFAVRGVEFVEGVVQDGPDLLPDFVGGIFGKQLIHTVCHFFPTPAVLVGPPPIRCQMPYGGVQPPGQRRVVHEPGSLARQRREDRLRNIFCQRTVTVHLSQRRRIDQIQVLPHQFGERALGTLFDVPAE